MPPQSKTMKNSIEVFLTFGGNYRYGRTTRQTVFLEGYRAVDQCEKRVVLAHTYVSTRVVFGAALANDDVARNYTFTTEYLNAQAFAFRFTTVVRTADPFFVCHCLLCIRWFVL